MPTEITMVKVAYNTWQAASEHEAEKAEKWKMGQGIKVLAVKVSPRKLKFLQKYWAGLIGLTFDYWQPDDGIIAEQEKNFALSMARYMDKQSNSGGIAEEFAKEYIEIVKQKRAQKYEAPLKTKEGLHKWIKDKLKRYKLIHTPTGVIKEYDSISFDKMSEEEFEQYYSDAFNVCWNYILNQVFEDQKAVETAINQLLAVLNGR